MFRNSKFLFGLSRVLRFFGVLKAPDMDMQVAKMLRKNCVVKRQLEVQIAKLAKSDFYKDADKKCRLERLVIDLDEWAEALQVVQDRMHRNYFGGAATIFEDHFWQLTVRLSTKYQFETGIFGDWIYDTNSLHMLLPDEANARKAKRDGANLKATKLRERLAKLRVSEIGELKLCRDCGRPMIPCENCGTLVKPCFLEIGMTHVCDAVRGDGARGEHFDAARN